MLGECGTGKLRIHLIQKRHSRIQGWGVFATQPIPKNKRIVTYDGEKITNRESLKREVRYLKQGHIWCFKLNRLFVRDADEQGARHDLVDAVFALPGQDDLVMVVNRVDALAKFLETDDGKNLLAGTKHATNILRIEEKKDKLEYTGVPDANHYQQAEEKDLAKAIGVAKLEADLAIVREDFASAMGAVAKLRPFVDAFFDKVTVNVEDVMLRANRLRLLNEIRGATRAVADFSKIEG